MFLVSRKHFFVVNAFIKLHIEKLPFEVLKSIVYARMTCQLLNVREIFTLQRNILVLLATI